MPLAAMHMPPMASGSEGGHGPMVGALQRFGGNSYSEQTLISELGPMAASYSREMGQNGYAFFEVPGMNAAGQHVTYGVVYAETTQIIVVYTFTLDTPPAPQDLVTPASRVEPPPITANIRPSAPSPFDAVTHAASTTPADQLPTAAAAHVVPLDLTTSVMNVHSSLQGPGGAAAGSTKSLVFSSVVSAAHSIPVLDGAGALVQAFGGDQLSEVAAATNAASTVVQAVAQAGGGQRADQSNDSLNFQAKDSPADMPHSKAALVGIPLNMGNIELALHTVMAEMESLGKGVTHWLDEMHLTPVIAAVAAATLGAGGAYYLRRRGAKETKQPDEEASSSWLFSRLHGHSG
jgi:hypothetical protein